MRFTLLLSALAALTSILASPTKAPTNPLDPITPYSSTVFERQLLQLTACVRLNLDQLTVKVGLNILDLPLLPELVSISVTERLCLCVVNGVLTQTSLDNVAANLQSQGRIRVALLGGVVKVNLLNYISAQALADIVGPALLSLLVQSPTPPANQCVYGTGAIPNSCSGCTYDCPASTPTKCNRNCISGACPSGLPQERRRSRSPLLCPAGLTACDLPNQNTSLRGMMECLDTRNNVEACGGCEFPLPGMAKGVDCTAIEFTDSVSCIAGKCVVGSCQRGFRLVGGVCAPVGLVAQSS